MNHLPTCAATPDVGGKDFIEGLNPNSLKVIDAAIDTQRSRYYKPKESKILMYGNRIIAALVFKQLPVKRFGDPSFNFEMEIAEVRVAELTVTAVYQVVNYVHRFYGKSMIPTLFKNQTKCRDIYDLALGVSGSNN